MSTSETSAVRELDRTEVYELLARNNIGRMAYARGSRIDIEPMHYVYMDGWIYGRTSWGNTLHAVSDSWWPVAFEVDEIANPFEWRSAVVHGGFYTLAEDGAAWERAEREKAIGLLRTLVPAPESEAAPVAARDLVFRIAVQEVSGRQTTRRLAAIDTPAA
jgi:uncharacterized protein